mmetsp:Transcript_39068/g.91945  ORF Transcript_39068/g.91945 Transcript_39068/m.91945 type:complete len:87 (+) Transcript_39068:802-1062(+)
MLRHLEHVPRVAAARSKWPGSATHPALTCMAPLKVKSLLTMPVLCTDAGSLCEAYLRRQSSRREAIYPMIACRANHVMLKAHEVLS